MFVTTRPVLPFDQLSPDREETSKKHRRRHDVQVLNVAANISSRVE